MNDLRTEEISHIVQFNGNISNVAQENFFSKRHVRINLFQERERRIARKHEKTFDDYFNIEAYKRPRFSNYLSDYSVPTGGTIALQVEVKGMKHSVNERSLKFDFSSLERFHVTKFPISFTIYQCHKLQAIVNYLKSNSK